MRTRKSDRPEPETFTQTVFTKLRDGVRHYGVIVRERFYPLVGVEPGASVELRHASPLEANLDGRWQRLSFSFGM